MQYTFQTKYKHSNTFVNLPWLNIFSSVFRFVTRGFYGIEHGLTIDVLVRNPCVKEEDIQANIKAKIKWFLCGELFSAFLFFAYKIFIAITSIFCPLMLQDQLLLLNLLYVERIPQPCRVGKKRGWGKAITKAEALSTRDPVWYELQICPNWIYFKFIFAVFLLLFLLHF